MLMQSLETSKNNSHAHELKVNTPDDNLLENVGTEGHHIVKNNAPFGEERTPQKYEEMKGSSGLWNSTFGFFVFLFSVGVALVAVGIQFFEDQKIYASIIQLVVGAILMLFSAVQVKKRFKVAKPNEWMIVVHDGKMVNAAIGLRCFRQIGQNVVTFSSAIQKVEFRAEQVSKEMAGIQITGFAIWSVFRSGEGPFRAYKYLDGLSPSGMAAANQNITQMAESVIRHQIANLSIYEIITQREHMRNKAKRDMTEVAQGWGVWMETVEITDVKVMSNTLFENLQCEFRQKVRLDAETINLRTQKQIDEQRSSIMLENKKREAESKTQQAMFDAEQQLIRDQQNQKVEEQRQAMKLEQIKRENEIEMCKAQAEAEAKRARVEMELKLDQQTEQHNNDVFRARMEAEKTMSQASLQRLLLETTEKIYQGLPIKDMKVINMNGGGGEGVTSFASMITGLAAVAKEIRD